MAGGMAKLHPEKRERAQMADRNQDREVVVERNPGKETPEFDSLNPGEDFVIRMQKSKIWEKGSS